MYKLILKMAWKNSFLRLSRTILVVLMIAVSMSMMLGIQGLYDGMAENMLDKNKRSDSGDFSMFAKEYRIDRDINKRIVNADVIKNKLGKNKSIEAVVTRVKADGLASTARKSSFAVICGIDLKGEEKFGGFSEFLHKGKIDFSKRGALLGIELAKTLKVKVGSKIVFSTQDTHGEINSLALRVRGIVQTTNVSIDNSTIYIDVNKLYPLLGINASEAMQIAIKSADSDLQGELNATYPDLEVKSFLELQPMMKMMQDMMFIFNSITFFIVMMVVFIGILGVMYVSILDRVREFGIMLAIGMEYKFIRTQVIMESVFVGFIGFVLGSIMGGLFLFYLGRYGLDLSEFADAMQSFGYETIIYATIKLSYFINTFLAIITASILSVLLPLRKIKKLNPVEVIKAEK